MLSPDIEFNTQEVRGESSTTTQPLIRLNNKAVLSVYGLNFEFLFLFRLEKERSLVSTFLSWNNILVQFLPGI